MEEISHKCPVCRIDLDPLMGGNNLNETFLYGYECPEKCPINYYEKVSRDGKILQIFAIIGDFDIMIDAPFDNAHICFFSSLEPALKIPANQIDLGEPEKLHEKIKLWITFS